MSYLGLPNTAGYDYFIYKDAYDSSKIKARNAATAQVEFNHATDFGNVFNSCVAALPAAGGIILIDSGTFETATTCTFKDYITVRGSGMNITIIKLANSQNKDVMATPTFDTMISNRPTNGYFTETGVIHDVTLENISIDGNKANNATGRYGLAKISYAWNLTNVLIYNCKSDGLYSEWGTVQGCPGTPDPTRRCMEDYWVNVYIHHCEGQGLRFRGPHDTYMVNVMCWGHTGTAASWEGSGTAYSGGAQVHNYHSFAAINQGTVMNRITTGVIGTNWAIEGGHTLSTGVGIDVDGSARLQLTGSRIFGNYTGIKINSTGGTVGYCLIEGCQFDNNIIALGCYGVQNKITGLFRDNTTDIELGSAGAAASYNDIRAKCTRSDTALIWGSSSNAQNYVELSVIALSGEAIITETGTPNLTTNYVSIWGVDTSAGYPTGKAMRYMPRVSYLPSYKKWGVWQGNATSTGDGLFAVTFQVPGTASQQGDATDGKWVRYTTAATTDANSGWRNNQAITIRGWNARMRVKFKIDNTACRLFLGWRGSASTDPSGDDPSNASPGFYFGKTAAASSWQVLHNDGTGATVVDNVAGTPAPDTTIHEVDFWTTSTGYGLRLDGGADNFFTAEVPSSSNFMALAFEIQTTAAAARFLDLYYVELVQDK